MSFQTYSYMYFTLNAGVLTQDSGFVQPADILFTEAGGSVPDTFEVGETYTDNVLSGDWVYQGYYGEAPVGPLYLFQSTNNANSYIMCSLHDAVSVSLDPDPGDWPNSLLLTAVSTENLAHCFLTGTGIATPDGEVAIESLSIGDLVLTAEGQAVPIKWTGRQTVSTRFGPADRLMPIRFAAGSLGEDLPHSDLTVTADHAMLVDGVLCNAGALVNGTTITQVPLAEMGATYTVYHIETEAHEIILANGAEAETFIDNVGRQAFDNFAEFDALYGDVPEMEELPYPRVMSARQLPQQIRHMIGATAAA